MRFANSWLMTRFFYDNEGKYDVGYNLGLSPRMSFDPLQLEQAAKDFLVP